MYFTSNTFISSVPWFTLHKVVVIGWKNFQEPKKLQLVSAKTFSVIFSQHFYDFVIQKFMPVQFLLSNTLHHKFEIQCDWFTKPVGSWIHGVYYYFCERACECAFFLMMLLYSQVHFVRSRTYGRPYHKEHQLSTIISCPLVIACTFRHSTDPCQFLQKTQTSEGFVLYYSAAAVCFHSRFPIIHSLG